jgi:polysaccharide export outer membrane protein
MSRIAALSNRLLVSVSVMLFCTACGGPVVKQPLPLGAPELRAPYPEQEYRIQVGDQLDIKFFYNPELNEQVLVRPDGRISLQLVHEVKVIDMSPGELTSDLMKRYEKDLARPEIAVIVRSIGGNKIFIDGEVGAAKAIDLLGPITVMQGITMAGGFKDTARRDEVILMRRGPDNKPAITTLNLSKVIDGTDPGQNIALTPFDIVYVPKSHIADVDLWMEQYLTKAVLVIPNSILLYYGVVAR